ncbi:protein FAM151B-like isoform X2 [Centruroides vittatus]|uniref:protein FAM151B-like isoform X2 n=1 Tax=Centruroides vittatus TaxID=120091 RepID=UPI00350FD127
MVIGCRSVREFLNCDKSMPPNLLDYFPEAKGDGLRISWAHGVNSKVRLSSALKGSAMILEADVSMSCNSRYPVPIMALPPAITSDLTLEEWLHEVLHFNNKGIKLNFRSTEVVEPACRVLARMVDHFRGPIILNADIVPGPNQPSAPVDSWTFLTLCRTRFPRSIISIGWATDFISGSYFKPVYTRESTDLMLGLIKEYSLMQPVMFPVCISILKYSIPEIQRLLYHVPNSSLVVWSAKGHPVIIDELLSIRKAFGYHQVFYDLPEEQLECFFSVT